MLNSIFRDDVSAKSDDGPEKSSHSVDESENQYPNEFQGKTAAVPVTYSDPNDPAKACLTLPDQTMINLLTDHFTPSDEFKFPVTCGRLSVQISWMNSRPWIRYRVQNDSIFCCYCVCFCKENSESPFVKTGFKNWKKASGVKENALDKHMLSAEHQTARESLKLVKKSQTRK